MVNFTFIAMTIWTIFVPHMNGSFWLKRNNHVKTKPISFKCCLDSIQKREDPNIIQSAVPVNWTYHGTHLEINDEKKKKLINARLKSWLENEALKDSIKSYRLAGNKEYYLLSSPIKQATGLAVNYTSWLIIDAENNLLFDIISLSDDVRAFYFEKGTSNLHFVSFTYGESFIHQKDYNEISYTIESYIIGKNGKELIGKNDSNCPCN